MPFYRHHKPIDEGPACKLLLRKWKASAFQIQTINPTCNRNDLQCLDCTELAGVCPCRCLVLQVHLSPIRLKITASIMSLGPRFLACSWFWVPQNCFCCHSGPCSTPKGLLQEKALKDYGASITEALAAFAFPAEACLIKVRCMKIPVQTLQLPV